MDRRNEWPSPTLFDTRPRSAAQRRLLPRPLIYPEPVADRHSGVCERLNQRVALGWRTGVAVLSRSCALTTGIARYSRRDSVRRCSSGLDVATSPAVTTRGRVMWFEFLAVESDATVATPPGTKMYRRSVGRGEASYLSERTWTMR